MIAWTWRSQTGSTKRGPEQDLCRACAPRRRRACRPTPSLLSLSNMRTCYACVLLIKENDTWKVKLDADDRGRVYLGTEFADADEIEVAVLNRDELTEKSESDGN